MDQSNYILSLTTEALKAENIGAGKCFLCGREPSSGVGEHVIPKWLQRRHALPNEQLTLLNGTLFFYRGLTIPACTFCNNSVLKSTEDFVSRMVPKDIEDWTPKHSFEVGRWMSKILLGILIKESALSLNLSQPDQGKIVPLNYFDELFLMHLLIQSWRKALTFNCLHSIHPFTLYVYQVDEDPEYGDFDISTNVHGKSICVRFGGLGFAFVADGGLQHHSGDLGPFKLAFKKVHPIQFSEIAARIHYKAALRDATHSYLQHEDRESFTFNQTSVSPYSNTILQDGTMQIFKPWSDRELAQVLLTYRVPGAEQLIDASGSAVFTRLVDENGTFLQLPTAVSRDGQGI
jgi:hypothetical protein